MDFTAALKKELGFLHRSCHSFDSGFHDEAVRIAVCIRVLIHDTKRQTSLLTHLKARDISLRSSCLDIASKVRPGESVQVFNGMGQFEMGPTGARYYPKLSGGMFHYDLPVEEWWAQTVFILDSATWVSRKDVVLTAADKDGGAHVDAALTPEYERLVASGDLGYFVDEHGSQTPITDHHFVALRQMGYELLNSHGLIALTG
jgi:hypothetical protein